MSMVDYRAQLHEAHKAARARMGIGQKKPRPTASVVPPRVQERKDQPDVVFVSSIPARVRLGACIYDAPIGPAPVIGKITIRKIQEVVSTFYGVRRLDMASKRRTAKDTLPRHIAMYLSRELTPHSLPEIGQRFGGRDHTSALWAIRKITALVEAGDAPTIEAISAIRAALVVRRPQDA